MGRESPSARSAGSALKRCSCATEMCQVWTRPQSATAATPGDWFKTFVHHLVRSLGVSVREAGSGQSSCFAGPRPLLPLSSIRPLPVPFVCQGQGHHHVAVNPALPHPASRHLSSLLSDTALPRSLSCLCSLESAVSGGLLMQPSLDPDPRASCSMPGEAL